MTAVNSLKGFLADTYTLMVKTHSFHWNVIGTHFIELHAMFEVDYLDLLSAADKIAERIRALGAYAPGGLYTFAGLTCIEDPKEGISAGNMLIELIKDHKKLIVNAKEGIQIADHCKDNVTVDMLVERIGVHEKRIWFMSSILDKAND